jgi:hypothetical protein
LKLLEPNLAASLRQDSIILLESCFVLVTKYGNFCANFSEKPFVAFAAESLFSFFCCCSAKFCQKEKD